MARIDTESLISVTEANRIGISRLVADAEEGKEHVVLRNNKPVAAVISVRRLDELEQLQDDLADITLAVARMLTTSERRHSLDDILDRFGFTREQLRDIGG